MFIQEFRRVRFISGSVQVELPRPNLILDPRVNSHPHFKLKCHYHDDGYTVTLTKTEVVDGPHDFNSYLSMRVYDPAIEDVPDFDSTIYKYSGLTHERAPYETTVAIIDPSVKTINGNAFKRCTKMKKCIMHDGVETIQPGTFKECESLETLFLPSSLKSIGSFAFYDCTNIRILSLPINTDISIEQWIIKDCYTFFQITQIQQYDRRNNHWTDSAQVHQAVIDLYRNLPPLHRACLDVNVSFQAIHDCIVAQGTRAASITDHDGMTPLHILSLNPHATLGSIKECFDADMSVAFMEDNRGNTPLDYLKENNLEGHTWIVTSLCVHCGA